MIRSALVYWVLLLFFFLEPGQQRLGAVAENSLDAHFIAHTGVHAEALTEAHNDAHSVAHTGVHAETPTEAHNERHSVAHTGVHAEALTEAHNERHSVAHTGVHAEAPTDAHNEVHDSVRVKLHVHDDSTEEMFKDLDTANVDHAGTDTLQLNLRLEGSEGDQTCHSSSDNFPCPSPDAIAPCVCIVDANNNIDLDCTGVESEEQLAAVFQQEFPVRNLRGFNMTSNDAIKVLGNILNGITFERIALYPGPFALQAVSEYFLLNSKLTLNYLSIRNSNLLSEWFPFAILDEMEALETLDIYQCSLTWIPKIYSSMIRDLYFGDGLIETIDPGTFDDVTNLTYLYLGANFLTELRAGTVPIREESMSFRVYGNDIQVIEPGTFFFVGANSAVSRASLSFDLSHNKIQSLQAGTFHFRNGAVSLILSDNQIASIEPGTFVFEAADFLKIHLYLEVNELTVVDEAVFGALMDHISLLGLAGNPLTCGCDIAWLVINSTFMAKVPSGATCADGTRLHELDPQEYVDFCRL